MKILKFLLLIFISEICSFITWHMAQTYPSSKFCISFLGGAITVGICMAFLELTTHKEKKEEVL